MPNRPDRRAFCAALAAAPWTVAPRRAAAAPRALQIVVPAPPGAQPDLLARWLLEPMGQRLGTGGTVANRPGASGAIAVDAVLGAPPDAGAMLLGGLDHVAYSHVGNGRRALDPLVDVVPAGVVNRDAWVVACPASMPFEDARALAAASRRDGPLAYGSGGEGSTAHLLGARLCRALGIEATHVPYRDSWLPDLASGRLQFVVAPVPALVGPLRGGTLRALATLSERRLPLLERVPTIGELGWPDQVFSGGLFLFLPATAADWAPAVNEALRDAVARPEVAARYRDASIEAVPADLDRTRAAVAERLATVDAMRVAVFGRSR